MAKAIEFFYDLSSPYSYLAATQLEAIAARHGATVAWKPMVLFAVFKASGNNMPAAVAAKAAFMMKDLPRWSQQYGVPFQMNSRFPINAIKPMRLCLYGDEQGKAGPVTLAAFRATWAEDRDVTSDETLRAIAKAGGIDPEQALAAIERPEIKERLKSNTDEAITRGVFGAPALFVGEELFWGNDRLHHVEAALAR